MVSGMLYRTTRPITFGSAPNRLRHSDSLMTTTRAAVTQSLGSRKRPSTGRTIPCTEKMLQVTIVPVTRADMSSPRGPATGRQAADWMDFACRWMASTSSTLNRPKSTGGSCVKVRAR